MLATAGRRYLLSLINSVHSIAPTQPHAGLQHLLALQPLSSPPQQSWCSYSTSTPSDADGSSTQQQQPQEQQHQQQAVAPAPADVTSQTDADAVAASSSGRPAQQPQPQPPQQQPPATAMGARRVDPSVFAGSKAPRTKREGIVHVNSTFNNTHLVLTDRASKVETWVSGGTVGYKNANKASPMAAEVAAKELARRALDKGFHSVVVKLKGMGKNKQFAVQSLAASGLTVTQIWDVTPIPYNGCRLPRRRRV